MLSDQIAKIVTEFIRISSKINQNSEILRILKNIKNIKEILRILIET